MKGVVRTNLVRVLAVGIVAVAAVATRLPSYSAAERARLASPFAFARFELVSASNAAPKHVRPVEPALRTIRSWISAVGAAMSISDIDGNGLPDDICLVDPRTDSVTVEPAPTTGRRYRPFLLDPAPLAYERSTTAPMGCLPGDYDEDGRTDLLVYYWGRSPVLFLRRPGTPLGPGAFSRRELVRGHPRWYTDSITQADVNGDGHVDLVVGNYFRDGSRVLDANAQHDPLMQMQDSMSRAYNAGTDRVLLWSGPGRFREAPGALPARIARGWTLAVGAADLNGDLKPELYFANDFGPDRLLFNVSTPSRVRFVNLTGNRGFTTPASGVLGTDSFKGMGVDFADLRRNGRLDIFVSNITDGYALEESNFMWMNTGRLAQMRDGRAPFVNESESLGVSRSGWSWDAKLGDFLDDGRLEIVQTTGFLRGTIDRWPELQELAMGNDTLLHDPGVWPRFAPGDDVSGHAHPAFWVQGPSGRFVDLAPAVGLGRELVSRGVATADVNGDGRLDLGIADQWQPSYFFLNRAERRGRFLGLNLVLPPAGARSDTRVLPYPQRGLLARPAIGAEAVVHLPGGRRVLAEVDGGNGHASVRAPQLLFGLGADAAPRLRVDLSWRDGFGRRRHASLALADGWHTIVLAQR